jgi:hypothetical protein
MLTTLVSPEIDEHRGPGIQPVRPGFLIFLASGASAALRLDCKISRWAFPSVVRVQIANEVQYLRRNWT